MRALWFLLAALIPLSQAGAAVNVRDYGAVGNCSTDDSAAFTSALAADTEVLVPSTSTCYRLTSGITIPASKELQGVGDASRIEFHGAIGQGITLSAGSVLNSLYLDCDGQSTGVCVRAFVDDYQVLDVTMDGGYTYNMEIRGAEGLVSGGRQLNSRGSAIALTSSAAQYTLVEDTEFEGSVGFGNWVTGGAHHNTFRRIYQRQGGLEAVGVTYESPDNIIEYSTAEFSGDNGFSVTSERNIVRYNIARYNANNGIGVYGSFNQVYGNEVCDNGTQNAGGGTTTYAGINHTPQFGGLNRGNLTFGNFVCETRAVSQQLYSIKLERMQTGNNSTSYQPWVSGSATEGTRYITAAGPPIRLYRYSATTPPANMGAVEPTDTSGSVVVIDGTNNGQYLGSFDTSLEVNWQAKVWGNITIGSQYSFGLFGNQWTGDVIANNSSLNPILSCWQVGFVKTASTISNNACVGAVDAFTRASGSISHTIKNNLTYRLSGVVSGGAAPVTVDGTNITGDPKWIGGPNPTTPDGFRPGPGSPMCGAGTYIGKFHDFTKRRILAPVSVGAIQCASGRSPFTARTAAASRRVR